MSISIVEPQKSGNLCPKFQAKFGVAEEEPDGPFQGLVQRYRQPLGHHVVGLQDAQTDRVHSEGTFLQVVSDSLPQYQNSIMQIHAVVTLPKPKRQHRLVATAGISAGRFS